jgi:hypothetical protein
MVEKPALVSHDVEARRELAVLKQQISDHEKICAERYSEIRAAIRELADTVDKTSGTINTRLWFFVAILLGGQMSVIGYLVNMMHK